MVGAATQGIVYIYSRTFLVSALYLYPYAYEVLSFWSNKNVRLYNILLMLFSNNRSCLRKNEDYCEYVDTHKERE